MHDLIGVDVGTSSCKAAVFEDELRLCALAQREYPLNAPRPGWAEFQPERCGMRCARRCGVRWLARRERGHEFGLCFSVFGDALIVADAPAGYVARASCRGHAQRDDAERIARDVGAPPCSHGRAGCHTTARRRRG